MWFSLLFGFTSLAAAHLTARGSSLTLNGIDYFVPPFSTGRLSLTAFANDNSSHASVFEPVTIVSDDTPQSKFGTLFSDWETKDDVWQPGFLHTVILSNSTGHETLNLSSHTPRSIIFKSVVDIPSGPYFLNTLNGDVHQAYRLYSDFSGSFTESLLQLPDGSFQTLSAHVSGSGSLTIGVPSRLYFEKTPGKPLVGVRIGVKDLYDLAGVKSSRGSRAWYELYPPANTTAPAIQNLIDAGGVIIGLQKLSQFANGESPTADWVSYHAPFNPRGDGYRDPSSSSSGAGASVGSYGWLDVAVGSDTGGSVRGPAGSLGLFGNRPSHGLASLNRVMPLAPQLDTAGLIARDPHIWDAVQAAMYGQNYTSFFGKTPNYPTTILALGFPSNDTPDGKLLHSFARGLVDLLQAQIIEYDIDEDWATSGPGGVQDFELADFLNLTYSALITKGQTALLRDPFFKDYAAIHDGRHPFIDPSPRVRWAWADSQPDSILDDAILNKTLFMNWFNENVLPPAEDPAMCSSRILLHTDSTGGLGRRDDYRDPPVVPFGWGHSKISIFSEAPDSVFPIGEVGAFSEITDHTEYLPVTVNVMVAKGCDGLLPRLAQDLVKAGVLSIPRVGATSNGGSILF